MVHSSGMGKAKMALIVFLMLSVFVGLVFVASGYLKPQGSAISIESVPVATVYLNGEAVGKTPYSANFKPGEVHLEIIPDGVADSLLSYETRINLNPGVKTIVRRVFGSSESDSSGETISFETNSNTPASLSIISDPDAAQISIDGVVKGFTPIKITKITPGEHQLIVSAPSYASKTFNVNAVDGYKLTVISKLAEGVRPSPSPTVVLGVEKILKEVLILDTPTGYLKVRRDPTTLSPEIGRVTPGLKYELVNTDKKTGWYQIKYDGEKIGWISNRYAAVENPDDEANPQ